MSVNLSIKNVPIEIVERLRDRAKRNHRSLQGELLAILEDSFRPPRLTLADVYRRSKEAGLQTPSESTSIIRAERDAR